MGGRNREENPASGPNDQPAPLWLFTDTETDLFRAGAISGLFALGEGVGTDWNIALYMERPDEMEKMAFSRGVAEYWPAEPLFSPEIGENTLVCAIFVDNFFFSMEDIPSLLIFFGWMDPRLASRNTLAIFDDSPWSQLKAALALLQSGIDSSAGIHLIPSEIIMPGQGMMPKNLQFEVNKVKNLSYWPENADN